MLRLALIYSSLFYVETANCQLPTANCQPFAFRLWLLYSRALAREILGKLKHQPTKLRTSKSC